MRSPCRRKKLHSRLVRRGHNNGSFPSRLSTDGQLGEEALLPANRRVPAQSHSGLFWVNNDCDWATYPGSPNFDPGSDKELTLRYSDQFLKDYLNFNPRSVRDLEDYARLWICGVPALTNGNYSVTLNWANVSGSPAINLS